MYLKLLKGRVDASLVRRRGYETLKEGAGIATYFM